MENYHQGDLTDIVRGTTYGCKTEDPFSLDWKFLPSDLHQSPINFSSSLAMDNQEQGRDQEYSFGDPFCAAAMSMSMNMNIRDPLLQDQLDNNMCPNSSSSSSSASSSANYNSTFFNAAGTSSLHEDELIQRPCNIFSRMLQISPSTPTNKLFPPISPSPSDLLPNSNNSPTPLLIHPNSDLHHSLHISSPRNPAGIKRRKSQARKVVCVPAPVAASSRPNGEVIPSDLWAWRKYGQKPIKGSPYPRGYYRCSSSKGCSARKQVERSRTDPNMLVITYTSEHNHPWPTQRNALAGSSRSQQSKNNKTNSSKLISATAQPQEPTTSEGDKKEDHNAKSSASNSVKEEVVEEIIEKQFEAEDGEFSEGFQYRMGIMTSSNNNQSDDFFADLEQLETDPLNLLFTQDQKLADQSDVVGFSNLFDWEAAGAGKRGFY